jgi:hypothetical protein
MVCPDEEIAAKYFHGRSFDGYVINAAPKAHNMQQSCNHCQWGTAYKLCVAGRCKRSGLDHRFPWVLVAANYNVTNSVQSLKLDMLLCFLVCTIVGPSSCFLTRRRKRHDHIRKG